MAGDRQNQIVVIGVHFINIGPHAAPQCRQFGHNSIVVAQVWYNDAPAVIKQFRKAGRRPRMFSPSQWMCRHKVNVIREMWGDCIDYRTLNGPYIADHCPCLEVRCDVLRDAVHGADRDAKHDKVGAFYGLGRAVVNLVAEANVAGSLARGFRPRIADDFAC